MHKMNTHGHVGVGKLETAAPVPRVEVTLIRADCTEKIIFSGTKMIFCPKKTQNLPRKMIFPGRIVVMIPLGRVFIPEKINFPPEKIVFLGGKLKIIGIKSGISGINRAIIPNKIRNAPRTTKIIPPIGANLGTTGVIYPVPASTGITPAQ